VKRSAVRIQVAVVALAAAAVMVVLASCGGGSSTAADHASLTKAELISKADAICRHTDVVQKERLAAYEAAHPQEVQEEAELRQAAFPPIGTEIKRVAALGSPPGDALQMGKILSGWRTALEAVNRNPKLVEGLTEGPFQEPDKLAAEYGFKDCAKAL